MKITYTFLTLTLASTIILTGCGGSTSGMNTTQSNSETSQSSQSNQTNTIQTGATKMLSIATSLKTELDAGNESKVKVIGPTLEDAWASFEDQVKSKYPDQYANVEKYLDPTIAGTKATPLDKSIVSNMNTQLIQALHDLEQKAK